MTAVVLYRRGNVWQCRTGTVQLFVTPVSTADCRRSVVALVPGIELDDVLSLTTIFYVYNTMARQKFVSIIVYVLIIGKNYCRGRLTIDTVGKILGAITGQHYICFIRDAANSNNYLVI